MCEIEGVVYVKCMMFFSFHPYDNGNQIWSFLYKVLRLGFLTIDIQKSNVILFVNIIKVIGLSHIVLKVNILTEYIVMLY